MVTENNIVEWSAMAKKFGFERVIAQMESIAHPEDFTGLAIDIHSPIEAIKKYLKHLEIVIVMSVEPGYGGQAFVDSAKQHLSDLSNLRRLSNLSFEICVDGGIEKEHLVELENLGADSVAVGVKRVLEWGVT
jgi:pentose-5-phosphate-3-epimerase